MTVGMMRWRSEVAGDQNLILALYFLYVDVMFVFSLLQFVTYIIFSKIPEPLDCLAVGQLRIAVGMGL